MRLLLGLVAWASVIYSVGMLVAFVGVARDVMSPCASTPGGCGADEAYAAEYFDGLVPFDTVLAGSRDLPADVVFDLRSPKYCSYAIVALRADAPSDPPKPRFDRRGKAFRWGFLSKTRRLSGHGGASTFEEAFWYCAQFWSRNAQYVLRKAIDDPTTVFSDGPPPGEFFLYSAQHRVAMRLRYAR